MFSTKNTGFQVWYGLKTNTIFESLLFRQETINYSYSDRPRIWGGFFC